MKPGIRHLSIGWRIALALALPLLAMCGFAVWSTATQYSLARDSARAREMAEFATVINTLVHSLQAERGASAAFVAAPGAEFLQTMTSRQADTDQARSQFAAGMQLLPALRKDVALHQQVLLARQLVDGLDAWRDAALRRTLTPSTVISRYGTVIADLIRVTQEMLRVSTLRNDVNRTLSAYARLMQAKEYAGLERGIGAGGFAGGKFDAPSLTRLIEMGEKQALYFEEFRFFATPADMALFNAGWSYQDAEALAQMRAVAQQSLRYGQVADVTPARWLALTTRRIDHMRQVEQRLALALNQQAGVAERSALQTVWLVSVLALCALVGALLLAWHLGKDIIRPLQAITAAMQRLAQRDARVELDDSSRVDEIGDMMRAVNVFRNNLNEVVQAQARQASEALLRRKENYQSALLDNFPFEVWLKDTDGVLLAANKVLAANLGLASPEAVVGKTDEQLLAPPDAARTRSEDLLVLRSRQPQMSERQIGAPGDAALRWVETWRAPVIDDNGDLLGTVGFARDITQDRRAQEEIRQLALYDVLTGLPNRRLLHERLNLAIMQSRRDHAQLGLIFVDLDNFKPVNDQLGHAVGDLLLVAVAQRLLACVREADTVARLGGDEFVVLLTGVSQPQDALAVAEKMRQSLEQVFDLTGPHHVSISSSIGVALFPEHGLTEQQLLGSADLAMYQAKQQGRNRVVLSSVQAGA